MAGGTDDAERGVDVVEDTVSQSRYDNIRPVGPCRRFDAPAQDIGDDRIVVRCTWYRALRQSEEADRRKRQPGGVRRGTDKDAGFAEASGRPPLVLQHIEQGVQCRHSRHVRRHRICEQSGELLLQRRQHARRIRRHAQPHLDERPQLYPQRAQRYAGDDGFGELLQCCYRGQQGIDLVEPALGLLLVDRVPPFFRFVEGGRVCVSALDHMAQGVAAAGQAGHPFAGAVRIGGTAADYAGAVHQARGA